MIAIIDYGAGNIRSVEKAFKYIGEDTVVTQDSEIILSADKIVLPGVGAFADAMEQLEARGLRRVVKEAVERNIPLLGICLGMQVLFDKSEEGPGTPGLSLFEGEIKHFKATCEMKVPQIGWNSIRINPGSRLFKGIPDNSYVYFVHSYYLEAKDSAIVAAECDYINTFHAAIEKGNVFACQFHPEKSSDVGLTILKNFAEL